MLRFYVKIRRYIINHSFGAFFFSHGGVHILAAIVMICFSIYFCKHSVAYEPVYKQIDVKYNDSFKDLHTLEIQIGTSEGHVEHKNVTSGLTVFAIPNHVDVTKLEKDSLYYEISKEERHIVKLNEDDPYDVKYICPVKNECINDTLRSSRAINISISTPNTSFIMDDKKQGDIWQEMGELWFRLDSLSHNYVSQTEYFDYNYNQFYFNAVALWGNFMTESLKNPYYFLSLNLTGIGATDKTQGWFWIKFDGLNENGIAKCPLNIIQCIPDTYSYSPQGGLRIPIQDVLKNGGVYLLAEDVGKKSKAERNVFFNSLLLGASLGFLIDILINLIIKWRNLAIRKKHTAKKH